MRFDKLNIGCGARIEPGWVNIDTEAPPSVDGQIWHVDGCWIQRPDGADFLVHDVRKGLPFPEGSIAMIHTEHFIEHLTRDEGQAFLLECHRVLVPGGVMRISTPDLAHLATLYFDSVYSLSDKSNKWKTAYAAVGYTPLSPCRMMNEGMRDWGHLFIYDLAELRRGVFDAGFSEVDAGVTASMHGKTDTPGMLTEGRPNTGDLIIEVRK